MYPPCGPIWGQLPIVVVLGWGMGGEVAPWLGMGNGCIGCAKRGWAMAPLLPVGWGWAMAALCGQGWDREGWGLRGMY